MVSHFNSQYRLMLQHATIFVQYRNHRKSSEAHCDQYNQKVATQTDIKCTFQLLQEPLNEKKCITVLLSEIYLKDTTLLSKFDTVGLITQCKK